MDGRPEIQYRTVYSRAFTYFQHRATGTGQMRSNLKTRALEAAFLTVLLASSPAGAEQAPTLELELRNGELAGDQDTFRFKAGNEFHIRWISDRTVDLHLHGYDVTTHAGPGEPGEMRFTGSVTGRFPVTSHGADGEHRTLIYVEIHPQ